MLPRAETSTRPIAPADPRVSPPEVSYNDPPDFSLAAFVFLGFLIGAAAIAVCAGIWVLLPYTPVFEAWP